MKRSEGVLSWDEYFMGLAKLSAMRSKDPNTQVGACIEKKEKKVVGLGYNGMPYGCDDDSYPWEREGGIMNTKYAFVVHAELNAILNSTTSLEGCTLYVSLFPCNECAKAIIQSGIKRVIYESDKYADLENFKASKKMLLDSGVTLQQLPKTINITATLE